MLNQTQREMTGEDYKQITGATSPSVNTSTSNTMANQMGLTENSGPMPGIDISKLDFVKKAKDIYDLANKKTKGQLT